ncbi:MAG: MFS transporter [Arthrobacter sp.]|uniref:MFS transporter n=1 Tax=Arthrobacter sp. AOP36-A1-22 TaxID=3457684 RepID=UPI00264E7C32|nr:MFS transporter [Micrococcaceae bacterium]MDN5886000.1 MFS transporter [Micrococcaceae bacterium]
MPTASPRARRTYPVFVLLAFVSMVGDAMALFALTLAAADQLGSWGVTILFLTGLIPPILAAPLVGRLVDGTNLRRIWVASLLAHVLLFALMALVDDLRVSLVLMCGASISAVINASAIFKLIPSLRGPLPLARASSLIVSAGSLAGILAPPIAALAYTAWSVQPVLALNALGFTVLALGAGLVVPRRAVPVDLKEPRAGGDGAGARILFTDRLLALLLIPMAAVVLFTSAEGVAGVFYLRSVAGNDTLYAVMLGAWSVGALIGALTGGSRFLGARVRTPVLLGGVLIGAAILAEGLWPDALVILAVFLLGGFGNGMHNTGVRNAVYARIPEAHHGAAWAYLTVVFKIMVGLGFLLGTPGLVVDSDRLIIIAAGTGSLAAVLLALVGIRAADRHRRTPVLN